MRIVFAVLFVPLFAGCVTELIGGPDLTVRTYTCAVLDPDRAQRVEINVWGADPYGAGVTLMGALANGTGRDVKDFVLRAREPTHADDAWAQERTILTRTSVRLHVAFIPMLPDNATTQIVAPGVIRVATDTIADVAGGHPVEIVGRTMVLHAVGHALGVVNRGTPINSTEPGAREGPAGHELSNRSVMHIGWHQGNGIEALQPRDRYSDGVRDDWARALQPRGVCA